MTPTPTLGLERVPCVVYCVRHAGMAVGAPTCENAADHVTACDLRPLWFGDVERPEVVRVDVSAPYPRSGVKTELMFWPVPVLQIVLWALMGSGRQALGLVVFFVMLRLALGWFMAELEISRLRREARS